VTWFVTGFFGLVVVTLFIATIALVIYTLVDVVRMPGDVNFKSGTQIVWVIVILLGGIIYLIVGRPPGGATAARQRPAIAAPPPPPPIGSV
jgi:hypothetical protein